MTDYRIDAFVVVVGHGVGQVISSDAAGILVRTSDGDITVRNVDAPALLRPVVLRHEAEQFWRRLCEPCSEERTLPELRSLRELARAPLERQVEYSRLYFRERKSLYPKEPDIIPVVSENVLAELAAALDVAPNDLRAAAKRGKPEIVPLAGRKLPPPPSIMGCAHVRSFWTGPSVIVGEWPEQKKDVVIASVKPGAWHAYVHEARNDDDVEGLVLIHDDERFEIAPLSKAGHDLGSVNLEGGVIGALDASALDDPDFGVEEVERTRRLDDAFADRGVAMSTFGDGEHRVFANKEQWATILLLVL